MLHITLRAMSQDVITIDGLTEAQLEAVSHTSGPLLVLAGPGSGKTTVVTRRIAQIISNGIPPWQILALTFTNKAANEMRERVHALLHHDEQQLRGLTVSTFHSFCARVLRQWGDRIINTNTFSIYDTSDQKSAVKEAIKQCELSESNWKPSSVLATISGAKNALIDASRFKEEATDFYSQTVANIYVAYDSILRSNNAVDFDDLLMLTATLLHSDHEVKANLEDRYQYVMVDEYQDTNHTQFVIANQIASNHRNFCVVGDPDQSIYAWRGADISNILNFESQYPDATVIPLGRNFRSTGHIVQTSATLIANNNQRKEKKLFTELEDGELPTIETFSDEHSEAAAIICEVNRLKATGVPLKEMAVLYRINALSRVLEDAFRTAGLPYVVARGTAFYERKEIKQAISYLRLIVNPKDNVAYQRVINTPRRGIGPTSISKLMTIASSTNQSLLQVSKSITPEQGFTTRAANAINAFAHTCIQWRIDSQSEESLTAAASLPDLVERVIRESGLDMMYAQNSSQEDLDRVGNLEELVSAATEFENRFVLVEEETATPLRLLFEFLEQIALVSDADVIDQKQGAVTLMTLHASKGLEFEFIAIVGLEEGILPHQRAVYDDDQLEEERRICYVGITRAKRHLLMTHARMRMQRGLTQRTIASRFIGEMLTEHVNHQSTKNVAKQYDEPNIEASTYSSVKMGSLVRHPRFGVGRVERILRRERGSTVTVKFARSTKHLVLEYAKLELVKEDEFDHIDDAPE